MGRAAIPRLRILAARCSGVARAFAREGVSCREPLIGPSCLETARRKVFLPAFRRRKTLRRTVGGRRRPQMAGAETDYFTSTTAPWSSSCFFSLAASSFETPSFTVLPPASTRSLASLRPRPVMARDFLDDVDLLVAACLQDDGELCLLFSSGSSRAGGASDGNSSRSRNAPLLFEQLCKLSGFQNGQLGEIVNDLGEIGHD